MHYLGREEPMNKLMEEALTEAIGNIEKAVGLLLVAEVGNGGEWMSLYGVDQTLLARVPKTDDPIGDIDRLQAVWFALARRVGNDSWD